MLGKLVVCFSPRASLSLFGHSESQLPAQNLEIRDKSIITAAFLHVHFGLESTDLTAELILLSLHHAEVILVEGAKQAHPLTSTNSILHRLLKNFNRGYEIFGRGVQSTRHKATQQSGPDWRLRGQVPKLVLPRRILSGPTF